MRACAVVLILIACAAAPEGRQAPSAPGDALRAALRPALPFPEAEADGTAAGADPTSLWSVRWPEAGSARVEVLANPLNPENHARALKAETAIQKAAMQSQQRSQADYEKAVSDFQRTGRVSEIREISLDDDGLAGERYDAESQLIVEARTITMPYRETVGTARLPEVFPGSGGPAAVVRVTAHEYQQAGDGTRPAATRFCAERAWLLFGPASRPVVSPTGPDEAVIAVDPAGGPTGAVATLVTVRGNVDLVDRVLQRADWAALKARLGL